MYIFIIAVVAIIATSPPTNKPADIKVDQTKSAITKTIATPKTTVQKVKPSKQVVKEVVKPKKIIKKAPVEVKKPEPIKEVVALEPKKQEMAKLETDTSLRLPLKGLHSGLSWWWSFLLRESTR